MADSRSPEEMVWGRIDCTGDGCWEYTGKAKSPAGYGIVRLRGKQYLAHRATWELTNGPIPDGLYVCHTCDNPLCCRPDHLFLGTQKANLEDMVSKGRSRRGDRNAQVKYSDAQVEAMRLLAEAAEYKPGTYKWIALLVGAHTQVVHNIITGKRRPYTSGAIRNLEKAS